MQPAYRPSFLSFRTGSHHGFTANQLQTKSNTHPTGQSYFNMPSVRNVAYGLLAAAAVATASDVTQLKKDTFEDFVKGNDIVLAECEYLSLLDTHAAATS